MCVSCFRQRKQETPFWPHCRPAERSGRSSRMRHGRCGRASRSRTPSSRRSTSAATRTPSPASPARSRELCTASRRSRVAGRRWSTVGNHSRRRCAPRHRDPAHCRQIAFSHVERRPFSHVQRRTISIRSSASAQPGCPGSRGPRRHGPHCFRRRNSTSRSCSSRVIGIVGSPRQSALASRESRNTSSCTLPSSSSALQVNHGLPSSPSSSLKSSRLSYVSPSA
jgi:hypothetical protein